MKKFNFFPTLQHCIPMLMFALVFTACSKDDDNDENIDDDIEVVVNEPGKISGLGETSGELTGIPFTLPEGVVLESDITGYNPYDAELRTAQETKASIVNNKKMIKSLPLTKSSIYNKAIGSGTFVYVILNLKNNTSKDINIEFPARLIIKSRSGDYQNGVLLKKTRASIPASQSYKIMLMMYCGNYSKDSSEPDEKYDWGVISNSSLIVDLCKRLADKKINYEEFNGNDIDYYYSHLAFLQNMLWKLTDEGQALSEDDIAYINRLPKSSN